MNNKFELLTVGADRTKKGHNWSSSMLRYAQVRSIKLSSDLCVTVRVCVRAVRGVWCEQDTICNFFKTTRRRAWLTREKSVDSIDEPKHICKSGIVFSDVGKMPKIAPRVENPFQAYLMSVGFIIYPAPRSFIRRAAPWYNCGNLQIFLRPMRLALFFEAGILISLSLGYDKILSLALIRIWFIFISILYTSTACSLEKKHWKTTFSLSCTQTLYQYVFLLSPLQTNIYYYLMVVRLRHASQKQLLLHTNSTKHISLSHATALRSVLRWMTHTDFGRNKKCLSLARSLQSTVQYKSVWTSLGTRVVQVTQHFVISSPFPRHCRWLLLCSNNIQFLRDSRSYSISPILSHRDKSKECSRC